MALCDLSQVIQDLYDVYRDALKFEPSLDFSELLHDYSVKYRDIELAYIKHNKRRPERLLWTKGSQAYRQTILLIGNEAVRQIKEEYT